MVDGANMGPIWDLSAPHGPHVGPMNLAIRDSNVIKCRGARSTLIQVMAGCLTSPSNYPNQCWPRVNRTRNDILQRNYISKFLLKRIWRCVQDGGHFVPASMCLEGQHQRARGPSQETNLITQPNGSGIINQHYSAWIKRDDTKIQLRGK